MHSRFLGASIPPSLLSFLGNSFRRSTGMLNQKETLEICYRCSQSWFRLKIIQGFLVFLFFFFKKRLIPRTHLCEFGFNTDVSLVLFIPSFLPTSPSCDSDTTKSSLSPTVLLSPDAFHSTRLLIVLHAAHFGFCCLSFTAV